MGVPVQSGLRERKKQRTRATLVAAALDLVDRQGYQRTTIEQIAGAAEVSPRTVAHYFPSKDMMLLSLLDTFTDAVNDELAHIPLETPPLHALLTANITMLDKAARGEGTMTAARVGTLLRIVNLARSLQLGTIRLRSTATAEVLARRIGTTPDDPAVALMAAVWAAVTSTAWQSMGMNETLDQTAVEDLPDFMSRTLTETFDDLVELTAVLPAGT
ncbi:TetR/AcrR family transcriptional regulator [Mycolicibacterium komossense]|uniref:TetR/AcrR family transcriptional regulator n=1 Tax=Mycolicibacterium komossense TaxID=1779 RepID=A0ABT3C994_9MYCO|nr:TetR/AcrR family transcriptional regulator [Mycolicibacterium komossense]MCV7226022.1 TetR/AcrR family transcriptional regulator [Mycolicibacterium komossense]